ncbi:MAG: DUF523 domain-containing protein [Campylobacterota bacterium]|nr:DUF523 domain-containing protein [Campylobacterota bacterium]
MTKLLISGCLFGDDVRYDGKNSSLQKNELFIRIKNKVELIVFCPEVQGGLSTPRLPSEIQSINPYMIKNSKNEDTTQYFLHGAQKTLQLCQENNIKIALLKSNSPSCSNDLTYNGNFDKILLKQKGVTAELLLRNNVLVFNENQLDELDKYLKNHSILPNIQ